MTIAARLYDWLLFAHVLAAMLWIGGLAATGVLVVAILRGSDPEAGGRFVRSLRVIGPTVLGPSAVLLAVFGIWLVVDDDGWDFGQTWLQLAIALFVVVFLVGAINQSRTAIAAERAAERGDHAEVTRQLRRWAWGTALILLLLVVATWDMVLKPGL
jgi:uncharacterized membrane protein